MNEWSLPHFFFKDFIYLFFRKGKGKTKRRRENVCLPLVCPLLGTWPTTQACALTGNWTGNPLVCRSALNPLSHTSQGWNLHHFFPSYSLAHIVPYQGILWYLLLPPTHHIQSVWWTKTIFYDVMRQINFLDYYRTLDNWHCPEVRLWRHTGERNYFCNCLL